MENNKKQGKIMKFVKMSGSGNDFIVIDNRKKIIKSPMRSGRNY